MGNREYQSSFSSFFHDRPQLSTAAFLTETNKDRQQGGMQMLTYNSSSEDTLCCLISQSICFDVVHTGLIHLFFSEEAISSYITNKCEVT